MPLLVNIRYLDDKSESLTGELPVDELEIRDLDELIHLPLPLRYELEVQKLEDAVLAQGRLELELDCECVRCLTPFRQRLKVEGWACHIPLEGDEKAELVNDCVDLTPFIREDIVLAFPQHPLCKPDCGGMTSTQLKPGPGPGSATSERAIPSTWAALDKLKL